MSDRSFPVYKFHKTKGHQRLESQAAVDALNDSEPGEWFNSPGEAETGDALPEPDHDAPLEAGGAGMPHGYIPKEYPKYLFKQGEAPKRVETPEEHEALGSDWHESPGAAAASADAAPGTAPTSTEAITQPIADNDPLKEPERKEDGAATQEDIDEFYASKAKEVVVSIGNINNPKILDEMEGIEQKNPNKPRASVLAAIASRRAELAKSSTENAG